MVVCQRVAGYLVVAVTLLQWRPGTAFQAQQEQRFGTSLPLGAGHPSPSSEEKSAADLTTKLLLLDELVSLENDVIETKKKRSFSGFGSPLDRLSAGSVDLKTKQRNRPNALLPMAQGDMKEMHLGKYTISCPMKVVEVPKRRFGMPLDRIGANRLNNSRGLPTLVEAAAKTSRIAGDVPVSPSLGSSSKKSKNCTSPASASKKL